MERAPDTIYVASISHGKDSNAMLHVIMDILHYPLDRIVTADVWFDENTRAELPPMVEWKDKADKIIFDRWGIPVEHLCAMRGGSVIATHDTSADRQKEESLSAVSKDFHCKETLGAKNSNMRKLTYKDIFYRKYKKKEQIYGFPERGVQWCTGELKQQIGFQFCPLERRAI